MLDSLDNYADNNNLYDISILSTLGFTDEDIEKNWRNRWNRKCLWSADKRFIN